MGKTLLLLSLVVAGLCGSEVRGSVTSETSPVGSAARTVVPGRTWWYTSLVRESSDKGRCVVYGMKLGDAEERDAEGWLPCYAVDRHGDRLFEASLGRLRDEGSQVWLIPNLNLEEEVPESAFEKDGAWLVRTFLGYWYGRELKPWHLGDLAWTDAPDGTPYLLYDYAYTVGDRYEWPWSGMDAPREPWWPEPDYRRGFFISDVTEDAGPDGIVRKEYGVRQLLEGESLDELTPTDRGTAKIVEGIGIVDGCLQEYIPDVNLCDGFWIAPASLGSVMTTGLVVPPTEPDLECVRDADGTCVYGDPEFDPETYDYRPWEEDSVEGIAAVSDESRLIYDLQGRKVTNPERGLYVRGGKKVVVRR